MAKSNQRVYQRITGISLIFLAGGLLQAGQIALDLEVTTRSLKWMAALTLGGIITLATAFLFALSFTSASNRIFSRLEKIQQTIQRFKGLRFGLTALASLVFPILVLTPLPEPADRLFEVFFLRAAVFWLTTVFGTFLVHSGTDLEGYPKSLFRTGLVYGTVHQIAVFFPDISTYPFSLTWSEVSRYYYGSLFFSETIYGTPANPSVLHPTRYFLQSLPFLASDLPLWAHRAWQVLLWVGTNGAAAWLLIRRIRPGAFPAVLWAFLFLFQGPIWYHLVIMIILVLWGYDPERFWQTTIFVLAASFWGGASRINWIPFPAALAGTLYLLETPREGTRLGRYLAPPVVWGVLGLIAGFGAQAGYAVWSGNALDQFTSSFTSDLLWYRLLPSATYPLGILPGILLASLPVLWIGMSKLKGRWKHVDLIRWAGLLVYLGVFLGGGIIVSVKIGGGSNLHNMDAYLTLLMVIGAYLFFDRLKFEREEQPFSHHLIPWQALAFAAIVPVGFAIASGRPYETADPEDAQTALQVIVDNVQKVADSGGEVLFIAERHLLSLGQVEGVALVEEYEKVFLMEMAMSGNRDYLDQFTEDLETHRFGLIVANIVRYSPQTSADEFGEENNAWDASVSFPLLCFYEELVTMRDVGVQLLVPRDGVACPGD